MITSGKKNHSYYHNLLVDNIEFIEKQCFRAVQSIINKGNLIKSNIQIENEALQLSTQVIDKLRDQDFKILRQYQKKAKLTTYLTAIISNQAIELIRKQRGRSREKERAKKYGAIGDFIYKHVFIEGYSISEAYTELKSGNKNPESYEQFCEIVDNIKGKNSLKMAGFDEDKNPHIKSAIQNSETGHLIIPDNRNPEDTHIENQHSERIKELLDIVISQLNGQERLILKMRFLSDDQEAQREIKHISNMLGISQKAVYHRISRILEKCQTIIRKMGVDIDELF